MVDQKPLFIVFEGLDGSGTSTQAQLLAEFLRTERHAKVKLTSEPSNGPIGQMIRNALSGRLQFTERAEDFDRQLAFLFAADRHDHLHNDFDGIQKSLAAQSHVICTRYIFSSYAYHCSSSKDFDIVESLNQTFPQPDLTIYLDVPVAVSIARLRSRSMLDKYENEEKLKLVRANYTALLNRYEGPLFITAAEKSIEEVQRNIRAAVSPLLKPH